MGCCCCGDDDANGQHKFAALPASEPIKFDKHFKGPLSKRSCTDVICLLIFIAFLGGWGFVGYFAYRHGDLDRLLVPTDSQGLKCGVDSEVLNKPYLVFFNIERCIDPLVPINGCPTPQVCVERCPNTTMLFDRATCSPSSLGSIKAQMICQRNVNKDVITECEQVESLIAANQCARWYLKSDSPHGFSVLKRCVQLPDDFCPFIPKSKRRTGRDVAHHRTDADNNGTIGGFYIMDQLRRQQQQPVDESIVTKCEANRELSKTMLLEKLETFNAIEEGQKIVEDIVRSWWSILIGLVIAMVCCLIVIAMMRWLAAPLLWLSILGVIAMLSFAIYYCAMEYKRLLHNPSMERPNSVTNLAALADNYLKQSTTWLVLLIVASVLLVIIILVVLVLRKRIVIAIALVKEGSKAVSSTYSTVFFPIFPWAMQIVVIAFALAVGLYLASVGDQIHTVVGLSEDSTCRCSGPAAGYTNGAICDPNTFQTNCHSDTEQSASILRLFRQSVSTNPCIQAACHFKTISSPGFVRWFHAVNIVGFFWTVFFIAAFGEMVLAATFATWYWTFNKSNVPFFTLTRGVGRTIRYHLGTLAFGALILTICRLIRVVLEYIDQKLKHYDNAVTRGILCCLKCFFWCLENFLKFLNRNAYIMCAVHGGNFCTSAKDAFNLLMRNFLRVLALDKVTDFLFFLSKLLVTLGMGAVTYFYLDSNIYDHKLHYNVVPVVIVMIGTYLIATVFFGVYSMAVDTLFLCFLEDCERNDGSEEKPYFMSKSLMKILHKRNDLSLREN